MVKMMVYDETIVLYEHRFFGICFDPPARPFFLFFFDRPHARPTDWVYLAGYFWPDIPGQVNQAGYIWGGGGVKREERARNERATSGKTQKTLRKNSKIGPQT